MHDRAVVTLHVAPRVVGSVFLCLLAGCSGAGGGGSGGGSAAGGGAAGGTAMAACGNGTLETNEPCEGFDLRGRTCVSEGFTRGELACTSQCTFDTSRCERCGDGIISGSETCDTQGAGVFGARSCATEVDAGATGELQCDTSCRVSTSGCRFPAPLPRRGEPCALITGCVAGLACDLVGSTQLRCRLHCPAAAIGTSQGCPTGESCLTGGLEAQGATASPPRYVTCTASTDCDPTFGCPDSGFASSFCARPTGFCQ